MNFLEHYHPVLSRKLRPLQNHGRQQFHF